jgi:3-oxoacyl-[acyl-carrier-protein] synthase I
MEAQLIAIQRTALATAVGLSAPASCAALRAKVTNPTQTRFIAQSGEWIMAHQVPLDRPVTGRARLSHLALMVIEEALAEVPRAEWQTLPLLLCVAETARPGRLDGLDDQLIFDIQHLLGSSFAPGTVVVPHGRVGVTVAMRQARALLASGASRVLVVAADSLVHGPTLSHYERLGRLLTPTNSDGFMPGEGAGAALVGPASGESELLCAGLGLGFEPAHIDSGEPLRADGLSSAINSALADAGLQMHDMDYRVTDLSGEQYYFKEAALALTRTLKRRKEEFETWHPAECFGEAGALAGVALLATTDMACRKGYALGNNILAHMSNDAGQRAAMALRFRSH